MIINWKIWNGVLLAKMACMAIGFWVIKHGLRGGMVKNIQRQNQ